MVTIKSAQINTPGLSNLSGSQASSSSTRCSHKKPGPNQTGVGETNGTDQMIKVIQLIIDLLTKIFGGKNETVSSQPASGNPEITSPAEGQSKKSASFIDQLGESILGFFSNAFAKLLG